MIDIIKEFLVLFIALSTVNGFLTEAVKKALDSSNVKYSSNIVAAISAVVCGGGGSIIYYIANERPVDSLFAIIMVVAVWVGSMVGYDKVIQTISQLATKDGDQ